MIGDAVDTLITLGWAFAVWFLLCAMAATAALYTVAVTIACACRALSRGVAAALAAVQRLKDPEPHPEPHKPPQGRTARPAPHWAHTDKDAA